MLIYNIIIDIFLQNDINYGNVLEKTEGQKYEINFTFCLRSPRFTVKIHASAWLRTTDCPKKW